MSGYTEDLITYIYIYLDRLNMFCWKKEEFIFFWTMQKEEAVLNENHIDSILY